MAIFHQGQWGPVARGVGHSVKRPTMVAGVVVTAEHRRATRSGRGHAVALEAAIILPALILMVALVIALARVALAEQAVGAAASQAARAASLERSPQSGHRAAEAAVEAALLDADIGCGSRIVVVDAAGLSAPLGTPSSVSVAVTCVISYDVSIPGFAGTTTVAVTRTSPVDTYRGR